jgi:hypothetical protein
MCPSRSWDVVKRVYKGMFVEDLNSRYEFSVNHKLSNDPEKVDSRRVNT